MAGSRGEDGVDEEDDDDERDHHAEEEDDDASRVICLQTKML